MQALLVIGTMIVGVGLFIWYIDRSCTKDMKEAEERRRQTEQEVFIENTKPKFKISFLDTNKTEYETYPFDAFAERSYRRVNGMTSYPARIVPSKVVAERNLNHAMEKGFITTKDGVRFPTCNILQAKVVQHV